MFHSMKNYLRSRIHGLLGRIDPESSGHPLELVFQILRSGSSVPCIVQIGASDGSLNDPLADFLSSSDCRAVLVEPLPGAYQRLIERHSSRPHVVCRQSAIDASNGKRPIFTTTEDCPYMGEQLSSFSREHLLRNGVKERHIRSIEVSTLPLSQLLEEENIRAIDLLQVDTEGFDDVVVKMALGLECKPRFINFEHLHISKDSRLGLHQDFRRAGYCWVQSGWDTLAWLSNGRLHSSPIY
jgi:FkbM family methyltransferase